MNNDSISRSVLTEELRERLVACNDWEEKAKDKETRIRANAVKTFICEMFMLLKEIPTVEPERPQGEWEYNQYDGNPNIGNWHCSNCHNICYEMKLTYDNYNFCPNCGADMRKGNDND